MVLNCGSSSVKYQLFESDKSILRGSINNIGLPNCVHRSSVFEKTESRVELPNRDYQYAIQLAIDSVLSVKDKVMTVGHRVVHGGARLTKPTLIDDQVLKEIMECCKLAPLHNPSNLKGIELTRSILPFVPQVACFDTAMHSRIPHKAYQYAIPRELLDSGIRRYGFHGLSYSYISSIVKERRMIVAHLGSGCSAAALIDGISVDTTMGFTPMEGLVMSTRAGTIDPGIILHLAKEPGSDIDTVSNTLNKRSGLLGLSGITSDMKELLRLEKLTGDIRSTAAHEAVEIFVYSVQKHLGQLLASINFEVDAFVFTGGIGENSPEIRERIIRGFTGLNVKLDQKANLNVPDDGIISSRDARIRVYAIPTDEERQIARDAISLVEAT
jgi:acetate kinase